METHSFISEHAKIFIVLLSIVCIAGLVVDLLSGNQTTIVDNINIVNIVFIMISLIIYLSKKISSKTITGILFYSVIINMIISQSLIPTTSHNWEFTFIRNNIVIVMFAPAMALAINRKHIYIVGLLIFVFYAGSLVSTRNQLVLENLPMLLFLNTAFILIINYLIVQIEKNQAIQEEQNKQLVLYNNELNKLVATKNRFFSIIAHDLKNPIGVLMGFSHLLVNNFPNYSEEKKLIFMQHIENTSKHTHDLLSNLLEWSISQSGNINYSPQYITPETTIDRVIMSMDVLFKSKDISIEKDIKTKNTLFADVNMLSTIIRNLTVNAVKYSPPGGTIRYIVRDYNEMNIAIDIIDFGVGMPDEIKNSLFKIECKTNSMPGTNNEKGTGLGLIVCKEFIEHNKGDILVESSIGKGSCFTIILPRSN